MLDERYYARKYSLGSWFFRFNCEFVLCELARIAGTVYDAMDRDAIEVGLEHTDSEIPNYFEYIFQGSHKIDFSLSNESDTDAMMILVEPPAELKIITAYMLDMACTYKITVRNSIQEI